MNAPVTRAHRELAVFTMYPDCKPDSYMWVEFVLSENSAPYRTLARVAQALADAEARPFSIERLIGIWTEINAYVVACGGTPPQPQDKSAAHWAATDKVQAYLNGQR